MCEFTKIQIKYTRGNYSGSMISAWSVVAEMISMKKIRHHYSDNISTIFSWKTE